MLSNAPVIGAKAAALSPAALPGTSQNGGTAGGPSFAQFLNDQPAAATLQPVKAAPEPNAPAAPREPDGAALARRKEAQAAPAKPSAKAPASGPKSASTDAKQQDGKADAAHAAEPAQASQGTDTLREADDTRANKRADTPADGTTPAETSGLNEFTQLIGLLPPTQPITPLPDVQPDTATQPLLSGTRGVAGAGIVVHPEASSAVDAEGDDGLPRAEMAESTATPTAPGGHRPAEPFSRNAETSRARSAELATDKATDKAAQTRTATSAEAVQPGATKAADAGARTPPEGVPQSFAAVLAQALPAGGGTPAGAPATPTGHVHAALHSQAFGPELAASVSLLAVEGVQQAELQLNPANMGPVAVQIVVDGAQAQISFHAVQADTRQALAQSLPDLAAALQSQGLTLSGGGVFQQFSRNASGGDRDGAGTDRAGSSGVDGPGSRASVPGSTAPPTRRATGLLDTFA